MSEGPVHGGAPRGWLEFSANLNPRGTPPQLDAVVRRAGYAAYADLDASGAERHLADDAGVTPDRVLLVAGATEAIRLIVTALLGAGERTIALGPTYGEYARLARMRGADHRELRASPPAFEPCAGALVDELRTAPYALAFACDPNNPTGTLLPHDVLRRIVDALPAGTRLVVDQSFGAFASSEISPSQLVREPNVILVRSLTKLLAAPGLRVGYVIAHPALLSALRTVRDPWPVGAHACAAAACATWSLAEDARDETGRWRGDLADALRALDLDVLVGQAPFLLVHVGPSARRLVEGLARERIAVRWCASFGLPEHVRIAVRPPLEQAALLGALCRLHDEIRW